MNISSTLEVKTYDNSVHPLPPDNQCRGHKSNYYVYILNFYQVAVYLDMATGIQSLVDIHAKIV